MIYISTDTVPDCQENPAVQVQDFPTHSTVLSVKMPAGILLRKHNKVWTLQSFPVPLNVAILLCEILGFSFGNSNYRKKTTMVVNKKSSLILHEHLVWLTGITEDVVIPSLINLTYYCFTTIVKNQKNSNIQY